MSQKVLDYERKDVGQPAPGARVALTLLVLINLLNYVDRQILSAVEKPIGDEYGKGPDTTGWLSSVFVIAYVVFAPIFGVLGDRMKRWALIGIGVVAWSFASGGSGFVPTLALLFGMRIVIGIGEAAYGPIAPALISDLYPASMRGKILAWFYAAIPVGSALGYVVGGWFHDHWRWAFYLTLPPGALLGLWCFFMPEPKRSESSFGGRATWDDYKRLIHIPSYVLVCAGMTAMTFAMGGIGYYMPRYLQEVGRLDPKSAIPTFGAIGAVAGLLATLAGGIAGDKLCGRYAGSYFIVSAGGMLLGFPLTLLMLITPFPLCWGVIFVAIFCLFFNTGPSNAIIANVTPPSVRATAFAVNILVIHALGDVISGPLIGWVAKRWGLSWGFALVSLMMLLGGILWLLGARFLEADMHSCTAANSSQGERQFGD